MKTSAKKSGGDRRNKPTRALAITSAGDQIVKRMTLSGSTLSTGVGNAIPVITVSSTLVQGNPAAEWASFAARYQQYRVRAIRISGKAINPVQTATITHSILYRGDFIGGATPTTAAQVLSDENVKEVATCKDFRDVVTWAKNPNARLWNVTSSSIPTANQFAWCCASPVTPPLTTVTTYYAYSIEWEVEFRGSQ